MEEGTHLIGEVLSVRVDRQRFGTGIDDIVANEMNVVKLRLITEMAREVSIVLKPCQTLEG